MPQSHVGIFRIKRTRSTPLDTKLMFWCVSYYLGPFGCHTKLDANWAELVQKFVPRSRVGIFRNELTRSSPLDPKLKILVHLGPFGCLTNLGAKRAELVQKFVPRSRVGIFRAKLTFWCVSYYSGAFGTVWLPYGTRCKTGRTSAKDRDTKSRRNISQGTHPIHPIGP